MRFTVPCFSIFYPTSRSVTQASFRPKVWTQKFGHRLKAKNRKNNLYYTVAVLIFSRRRIAMEEECRKFSSEAESSWTCPSNRNGHSVLEIRCTVLLLLLHVRDKSERRKLTSDSDEEKVENQPTWCRKKERNRQHNFPKETTVKTGCCCCCCWMADSR